MASAALALATAGSTEHSRFKVSVPYRRSNTQSSVQMIAFARIDLKPSLCQLVRTIAHVRIADFHHRLVERPTRKATVGRRRYETWSSPGRRQVGPKRPRVRGRGCGASVCGEAVQNASGRLWGAASRVKLTLSTPHAPVGGCGRGSVHQGQHTSMVFRHPPKPTAGRRRQRSRARGRRPLSPKNMDALPSATVSLTRALRPYTLEPLLRLRRQLGEILNNQ